MLNTKPIALMNWCKPTRFLIPQGIDWRETCWPFYVGLVDYYSDYVERGQSWHTGTCVQKLSAWLALSSREDLQHNHQAIKPAQEPLHFAEETNRESTEGTTSSGTPATPLTRFMASAPAFRSSSILERSGDHCDFKTSFLDLRVDWCFNILLPSSCCFCILFFIPPTGWLSWLRCRNRAWVRTLAGPTLRVFKWHRFLQFSLKRNNLHRAIVWKSW